MSGSSMQIVTLYLDPEEPAYGLWEGFEVAPVPGAANGETAWRWLQKVFVVRGDTIAKYITDMGPAEDYELITPIFLPCHGTDTVGRLQYYAEKNRQDTYWQTRAKEQLEASTLISGLIEQEAKIHEIIRNRTTVGPYVTVQRNGYAHEETVRKYREKRRQRTGKVVIYGTG